MVQKLKSPTGRLTKLLAKQPDNGRVIEQLYLSTLSRPPTDEERDVITGLLQDGDRDESLQDVFWALLNSKEFAFQH
jgi:hypothetical protein